MPLWRLITGFNLAQILLGQQTFIALHLQTNEVTTNQLQHSFSIFLSDVNMSTYVYLIQKLI